MKKENKKLVQAVDGVSYQYEFGKLGQSRNPVAMIVAVKGAKGNLVVPAKLGKYRVAVIGDYAFTDCKKLESVTLPTGLKVIGLGAFERCTRLSSVRFPEGLIEIHAYAFTGCTALKSVDIPGNVELLASRAFEDCTALESVRMPCGIKLGYLAYHRKYHVKLGFSLPKAIRKVICEDADKAFAGCTGLKTVTVVGGVTPAIRKALRGMKVRFQAE